MPKTSQFKGRNVHGVDLFIRYNQHAGKAGKNGRYAMQIEKQSLSIRRKDSKQTIEMKWDDCHFVMMPERIQCSCFMGDFDIYSACELKEIFDQILHSSK